MDLLATLRRNGGLQAIARQTDAESATVLAASETILPFLVSGLRQFVAARGGGQAGVNALLARLNLAGDGDLAANLMGPGKVETGPYEALAAELFGNCDWRALARDCAIAGHLDVALAEHILVQLAMLVSGYISARAGGSGARDADAAAGLGPLFEMLTGSAGGTLLADGPDGPLPG